MNRLASLLLAIFAVTMVSACQHDPNNEGATSVSYRTLISRNQANINKLSLGMSRAEVEHTMGAMEASTKDAIISNPYKVEPMLIGQSQFEVLYYLTRKYPPFTPIKISQATPVILKDGKVAGWGWDNLRDAKAGRL